MTYGISKSLLPPAAINTSQLWDDLAPHQQHPVIRDVFGRQSRWDHHTRSPSRRAKSHSPSRRSPKIKHTNGRLDEDPIAAAAVLLQTEASAPRSCEGKEQLLARLRPTVMLPTPSRATKERGMSESEIPKRALIRRSITAVPPSVRALEPSSSSPTRQLKACYRDDALRERSAENARRMIVLARQRSAPTSPQGDTTGGESASSNQQKLALKALKYRKLLARAREIDEARLTDPTFDVLEGLGVKWSKAS